MAKKELNELKKARKEDLQKHYSEVEKKLNSVHNSSENYVKMMEYSKNKKFKWWDWILVLSLVIFGIGFSFGIGYLLKDRQSINHNGGWFLGVAYSATAYIVLLITTILIVNFIRNRKAVNFYNDKRLRYQKTFTKSEAILIKIRNILILSTFCSIIFVIVMYSI